MLPADCKAVRFHTPTGIRASFICLQDEGAADHPWHVGSEQEVQQICDEKLAAMFCRPRLGARMSVPLRCARELATSLCLGLCTFVLHCLRELGLSVWSQFLVGFGRIGHTVGVNQNSGGERGIWGTHRRPGQALADASAQLHSGAVSLRAILPVVRRYR